MPDILQNLRDFTVQIRKPDGETIVGTGLAVSLEGEIVTCAHVVKSAIGVHPREAGDAEIGVYFPQAGEEEEKARRAAVARFLPHHADDIAVLQLVDGAPPLAPEQVARIGAGRRSPGHGFRSYGYAPVGNRLARYADGKIMGPVEIVLRQGEAVMAEPLELRTRNVRRGLSGGAVLDVERNLVVGLISDYWAGDADPDNIAYATDCTVLTFDESVFALEEASLPKGEAPQPRDASKATARQYAGARSESQYHAAPPPLDEWVGRAELLAGLSRDYADPARRVTGLIGFGGEGKSSLARKWVDLLTDHEVVAQRHYRLPITDYRLPTTAPQTASSGGASTTTRTPTNSSRRRWISSAAAGSTRAGFAPAAPRRR